MQGPDTPRVEITRLDFPEGQAHESRDSADYNVSNLWTDGKPPDDYEAALSATATSKWVELSHPDPVPTLVIDSPADLHWMKQANADNYLGVFSHIYDEELRDTVAKYECQMPRPPIEGWFIRTQHVSLKEGMYGIGPYYTLENIIKSIVTSSHRHRPLRPADMQCTLFFFKWQPIDPYREFRAFVYQNRLTALSAQRWHKANPWLAEKSDEDLQSLTLHIVSHFYSTICERLLFLNGNYTYDLAIREDGSVYFIEPNAYGATYSAGSSLFHWVKDEILLSDPLTVQLRFVAREVRLGDPD
ncbi:hypothetical protein HDU90_006041 [Geranomyces variabilis]|nr:hypothetical protein HDU90_006041 [Geranomyces variabilis]